MRKYYNEGIGMLIFGVLGFCYFTYQGFTREYITNTDELVNLKGKYIAHSFKDNTGHKGVGHQYYIWAEPYTNRFQIPANYLGLFRKQIFEFRIKKDDIISFTIPQKLEDKLNTDYNIIVTSIRANGQTYLNKSDVINRENELSNSYSDFYLAIFFLIIGIAVYLRYLCKDKNTNANIKYNA